MIRLGNLRKTLFILNSICLFHFSAASQDSAIFASNADVVYFESDAPLEFIEAKSNELRSILNTSSHEFGFSVDVNSFKGFNSPLQRQHFNENYLESDVYPTITFVGRFVEDIDYGKSGRHEVRAKGTLNLHGVSRERIIPGSIEISDGGIHVSAEFSVLLQEYDIAIPRIVRHKISEEIKILVTGKLVRSDL